MAVGNIVETDEEIRPELEFVTGNGGLADRDGVPLVTELEMPVPDKPVAVVGELVWLAASEEDPWDTDELGILLEVLANDVYVVENIDGRPDSVYGVELPEIPVPFEFELGDTVGVKGTDTKLEESVLVVLTKGIPVFVFVFVRVTDPLDGAERAEFDDPGAVLMGLEDGNGTGSVVEFEMGELETVAVIVGENVVDRKVDEKTVGETVPLTFNVVLEIPETVVVTPEDVEFDVVTEEDLTEPEADSKSDVDDVVLMFPLGEGVDDCVELL